jgi:Tetracyclin repressor-like, C-terminal domain
MLSVVGCGVNDARGPARAIGGRRPTATAAVSPRESPASVTRRGPGADQRGRGRCAHPPGRGEARRGLAGRPLPALPEQEGPPCGSRRGRLPRHGGGDGAPHRADPAGRLRALGRAYVEFATRHPAHFRVMFGRVPVDRAAHPGLQVAAAAAYGLLIGAIRDCQAAGVFRAGDAEELALCAWSAVHGLSALVVDGQLGERAKQLELLARAVTDNVVRGLAGG